MKVALVLSGGGGRGGYQLGVWQALDELETKIDIVTGTSVGALNGVFYVQRAYDIANRVWRALTPSTVLSLKNTDSKLAEIELFSRMFVGGTDALPLEKTVKELLDEEAVRKSDRRFGLVTVRVPSIKALSLSIDDIPEGKLADYVIASVSAFPMFKPKQIDGEMYIDGGYYDNKPINLALDMGADKIICIDLEAPGNNIRRPKRKVETITIKPRRQPGNFMQFDSGVVEKYAYLGYTDTLRTFGKVGGNEYCFYTEDLEEKMPRIQIDFIESLKRIVNSENINLIDRVRFQRKFKHFDEESSSTHKSSILIRLLELCGNRFELVDDRIYQLADFNDQLIKKVHESIAYYDIENKGKYSLAALVLCDDKEKLAYIYTRIIDTLGNDRVDDEIVELLSRFTTWTLAAIYLFSVEAKHE